MDLDCPRFSGLPEGSQDRPHPNSSASRPTLKEHLPSRYARELSIHKANLRLGYAFTAIRPAVESPFSDRTDNEMSEKGPASMSRSSSATRAHLYFASGGPQKFPTSVDLAVPTPDPGTSFSHTSECEHSISLSTIIIKVRLTDTWSGSRLMQTATCPSALADPCIFVTGPRLQAREEEIEQRMLSSQHPNPSQISKCKFTHNKRRCRTTTSGQPHQCSVEAMKHL